MTSFLHLLTLSIALSTFGPDDNDEKTKAVAMPLNVAVTQTISMSMYPSYDQSKMNVHVLNHQHLRLKVHFLNEKGLCLASEFIPRNIESTHLKFNVAALPAGAYKILINDGKSNITKQFEINEELIKTASRVQVIE